jgi:hypothetical protein
LSVTYNFGAKPCFLSNLRISRKRRPAVAAALDQHVEHLALVIDGTPEIHPLASNPHHHLVQMPAITWLRALPTLPSGDYRPELQ